METLDKLIIDEENKIDYLLQRRTRPAANIPGERHYKGISLNVEYDIEKAYEQLAIFKIRKMMGFG